MAGDAGNGPPRFTTGLYDLLFVEGRNETFAFAVPGFTDPEGDVVVVEWDVDAIGGGARPTWLFLDPSALRLSGTAPPGSPDYVIRVTLTDGNARSATERFTLYTDSGATGNRTPVVSGSLPNQVWPENGQGSYVIPPDTFVDPDGDLLTLSVRSASGGALPDWLRFDSITRTMSGTPPAGSDDVVLRVTAVDPSGASASVDLQVSTSSANVTSGTNGSDTLTGGSGPDVLYGLAGNDLILGGGGSDTLDGGPGADRLDGGSDADTAVFPGSRDAYLLSRTTSGVVTVSDRFGELDTLVDIESIQFSDVRVSTSSLAYAPVVSLTAAGANTPIYRFFNVRDNAYFYTPSANEKDLVIRESTDASYTPQNGIWPYFYQGATFAAAIGSDTVPVYRFYNTQTGHHFFTVSPTERDLVQRESTDPSFTPENGLWPFVNEGIGYQAFADGSRSESQPVFRFFSPSLNRHFFTADADEAQQVRQTGQWNDEGVAFWGGPTSGNQAPVLAAALFDLDWPEGGSRFYQLPTDAFVDADGDTLTYSATTTAGSALPSWLALDPTTGSFSGTAPVGGGDISVRVTVRDGRGGSTFDDFTLFTVNGSSDDYPASASSTGRVEVNGSARGTIETAGDTDWFRVSLVGGRPYVVDLMGAPTSEGTLGDPLLVGIYGSGGKAVSGASDDDSGEGFNARVNFTPSTTGQYFISAGAVGSLTGSYTLAVTELDDRTASTSTTGTVSPGSSVTGTVEAAGDQDWFRVSLTSGRTYTIDLAGLDTGQGALNDPYLYGIYDSSGKLQSGTSNDDVNGSKGQLNSRVTYTPANSATYYISAGANGAGTGGYQLTVSTGSKTGGLSLTRVGADGGGYSMDPALAPRSEAALVGIWDASDGVAGS